MDGKIKGLTQRVLSAAVVAVAAMSPTHTRKKNKHYHYYVANSYRKQMCDDCPVNRIPAGEIEAIIVSQMRRFLPRRRCWSRSGANPRW